LRGNHVDGRDKPGAAGLPNSAFPTTNNQHYKSKNRDTVRRLLVGGCGWRAAYCGKLGRTSSGERNAPRGS
jgi:hypothetical protein